MSADECDDCADYCYRIDVAEQEVRELREKINGLLRMREFLIEWVQEDCPYSREDILRIAEKEKDNQKLIWNDKDNLWIIKDYMPEECG